MLAPQSGQTRLRIAEIKFEFGFVTKTSEAIMSLPTMTALHRRKHKTLSGAAGASGESACWIGVAALASDSHLSATKLPNALRKVSASDNVSNQHEGDRVVVRSVDAAVAVIPIVCCTELSGALAMFLTTAMPRRKWCH
jgi:hypothetical protein